jgi:hypothetical protein
MSLCPDRMKIKVGLLLDSMNTIQEDEHVLEPERTSMWPMWVRMLIDSPTSGNWIVF